MYQPDMICFENDFETPGEKSVHFERSPFWYMYTRTSILINQSEGLVMAFIIVAHSFAVVDWQCYVLYWGVKGTEGSL